MRDAEVQEYEAQEEEQYEEGQTQAESTEDQEPELLGEQNVPEPQEDWRVQAIRNDPSVRERFDRALFGGQEEQQEAPPKDPVTEAQEQLREIESQRPEMDTNNMTAEQVQQWFQWQDQYYQARDAVQEARINQQESRLQSQQAKSQVEDYIQQAKTKDPEFKNYEQNFRQYIRDNNINPQLLGNPTVVEMIRKAIGYDHLQTRGKKAKAPAPAVDESYTQTGRSERKAREQQQSTLRRQPTEQDEQIAAFYGMSPQEYLSADLGAEDQADWEIPDAFQFSDRRRGRA